MDKKLQIVINLAEALNAGMVDESMFKDAVFDYISDEEHIIPNMLEILKRERTNNKELLSDMNLELSRVSSTLEMEKEWDDSTPKKRKSNEKQKQWIYNQAILFYYKWKNRIGHCFMNPDTLEKKYAEIPADEKKQKEEAFR